MPSAKEQIADHLANRRVRPLIDCSPDSQARSAYAAYALRAWLSGGHQPGTHGRQQAYTSGKTGIQTGPAQRGNQGLQPGPERPSAHDQRRTGGHSGCPGQTRQRYGTSLIPRRSFCSWQPPAGDIVQWSGATRTVILLPGNVVVTSSPGMPSRADILAPSGIRRSDLRFGRTAVFMVSIEGSRFPDPKLSTLLRLMRTYGLGSLEELLGPPAGGLLAEAWEAEGWQADRRSE